MGEDVIESTTHGSSAVPSQSIPAASRLRRIIHQFQPPATQSDTMEDRLHWYLWRHQPSPRCVAARGGQYRRVRATQRSATVIPARQAGRHSSTVAILHDIAASRPVKISLVLVDQSRR